jgi:hypothetical protein
MGIIIYKLAKVSYKISTKSVHGLCGSTHLYLYVNRALLRIIAVERSNRGTPSGRSLTHRISTSGNIYAVDLQGNPIYGLM